MLGTGGKRPWVLISIKIAAGFCIGCMIWGALSGPLAVAQDHAAHAPSPSANSGSSFFENLFKVYVPRRSCMFYEGPLIWLHAISDALIALAYYSIPVALAIFVRRRQDLAFSWIFWLFAGFILSCGTTHLLGVLNIWHPWYRVDGIIKGVTAALSVVTAIALWPLIPRALALPSPGQLERTVRDRTASLEKANAALRQETTARTSAEQERERLAAIVESSEDAIVSQDLQGRILSWNPAAQRLFGYTKEEIVGQSIARLLPSEQVSQHMQLLQHLKRGEHLESVRVARSGRRIEVSIAISPVKDAAGHIIGASTIIRDISEKKHAEERFRLVVESAPSAMIMIEPGGRIILVNAQTERVFGYRREELIGQTIELLVPHRFHAHHPAYRDGFMNDPRTRPMGAGRDLFGLRKDGTEVPVEIGLTPIQTAEGTMVLASVLDITQRKAAEEELRQLHVGLEHRVQQRTAELAAANQELEAFSYSVSHDLRAPLRHVMSFVLLLEKHAGPVLDDKSRHYIKTISEAGKRMGNLIDDLLTLSRIGRTNIAETDVDLDRLVNDARQELASETTGRQIQWQVTPLPTVRGDPTLLRAVVMNLLANAIKYSRQRDLARIEVGFEQQNGEMVFFVRDNGAGFDMKFVDKLFGVFQRLHRAEEFEGTGIGLASVRRIILRHGGRTWAQGVVDQGATFYFSLPQTRRIA